jgi:hypothetical protein
MCHNDQLTTTGKVLDAEAASGSSRAKGQESACCMVSAERRISLSQAPDRAKQLENEMCRRLPDPNEK